MQHAARNARSRTSSSPKPRSARPADAIGMLKADHRQVEDWFRQFEKSRSAAKKGDLAGKICHALRVHATIEEKVFYPAFLEASDDQDLHHEAVIEHSSAKELISRVEKSRPDDEYFDSRVKVLSEMIKHHVKEEEKRDGMFAKAKSSDMDLMEIGRRMMEMRSELEASGRLTH